MDVNKGFDVSEFNVRFEMTFNSIKNRKDLRIDPGWDELFYERFSDEETVMNIDGGFRSGRH